MSFTFKGGIHPAYNKRATASLPVEYMPAPKMLYFPVQQHIGAPCAPAVKAGDRVLLGQTIASSEAPVSSPIHASCSGTVVGIAPGAHPGGAAQTTIVIENDFQDELSPEIKPCTVDKGAITAQDVIDLAKKAGIVGMGGAGFPAQIKIASAVGRIDTLLINGAECEPYLTADHRLMLEQSELVVEGADILRRGFGLPNVTFCIENNKADAAEALRAVIGDRREFRIAMLATKYPQGSEKHIIKAVTGREVPSGQLPAAAKCAVFNVDSAASIARAFSSGSPVYQRILTVSGSGINIPKNLLVRLGTRFGEVIDFCGGLKANVKKIIMGGPMMGVAQYTLDVPVIKTTSGILVFTDKEEKEQRTYHCIRCGRCVRACPMGINPCYINRSCDADDYEGAEKYDVMDCIECGSCSYVCPAKLNLVAKFRVAKLKVGAIRKKREGTK